MFKLKYVHLLICIFMILLLCILLFNKCNRNNVCDKFTVGAPCTFGADAVAGNAEEAIVDEVVVEPEGPPEEPVADEPVADEPAAEETEAEREQARCNPFTTIERQSKAAFSSCGYTKFDPSKADVGGISDIWLQSYYNESDPCGVEWSEYNEAHDNTRIEGCPVIEQYPRNDWRVCLGQPGGYESFANCLRFG
jgi:hypothetical protein